MRWRWAVPELSDSARRSLTGVALTAFSMLYPGAGQAHQLKVFAFAEDGVVQGSVYFSGGAPAPGARIRIRVHEAVVAELRSDASGDFLYRPDGSGPLRIIADTGDGHGAEWSLDAAELLPGPAVASMLDSVPPTVADRSVSADTELSRQLERAVARQIRPLREQLIAYEERLRWRDILGGLGYIVGIAGLGLWWHGRGGAKRK